ncbi:hypothetical protein ACFTS5_03495 [Nocardia sp. NPDC056952]|uniref:YbaB/EbfC family nucleoid-associated protein n=1 Tax=Nocardia sp. NPDC056952 TaxID=3345979 RepID=UPI00363C2AB1
MGDIDPVSGHIEQLQRALTDARGRAVSADGSLRLEAGANGTIHSIELGEGGAELSAAVVVSLIADLHREAVTEATATMRAAVAALTSDPRLHDERQEVVDKLSRPRIEPETVAAPKSSPPPTRPSTTSREGGSAPRLRSNSPSAEPLSRSTSRQPAERGRTTTRPTPPRQSTAPPNLSEFDPVTFAPLPRAKRPAPPNQRPIAPHPGNTTTDAPPNRSITHDSRDIPEPIRGDAPDPVCGDTEPASGSPSAELNPAKSDFVPADPFAPWGDPGDGTGIAPGSWLPDDNLLLSDDWWDWPR